MRSAQRADRHAGHPRQRQHDLDLVDEDLHPDTVALYTSLRGSRRPQPAQQGRHSAIPQS
jgi:hypothetical protein